MPLLSPEEAFNVSDGFLQILYGEEVFQKWKELKYEMKFDIEREFVSWLIDVANHYKKEGYVASIKTERKEDFSEMSRNIHYEGESQTIVAAQVKAEYEKNSNTLPAGGTSAFETTEDYYGTHNEYDNQQEIPYDAYDSYGGEAVPPHQLRSHVRRIDKREQQTENIIDISEEEDVSNMPGDGSEHMMPGDDGDTSEGYPPSAVADVCHGSNTSDQKKFTCPHCSYSSNQCSHLKRHLLSVHEKQKPHACDHCAFICSRKDTLKRHLILKHGYRSEYQCCRCSKYFVMASDMQRHEVSCKGVI